MANVYVTSYNKWYKEERPILFSRIFYVKSTLHPLISVFPKFGSSTESRIAEKIISSNNNLSSLISSAETNFKVFYKITGVGHWITITARPPKFYRQEIESSSTREQSINFANELNRDIALTVLNSTTFYWFYQVRTNCRDFNPSDFRTFPLPNNFYAKVFSNLSGHLQKALNKSSSFGNMNHSQTGAIKIEQFKPKEAKPIIDEIDRILAKHYGFTDEEVDFIINYDIKYRMGRDNGEGEES